MRHRKNTIKLGRTSSQREALFSSLVSNLILAKRITTTLPKARAAKRMADKIVTVGKKGTLAARRHALSLLKQEAAVAELFGAVAPAMKDRQGGYTRVLKLGKRISDSMTTITGSSTKKDSSTAERPARRMTSISRSMDAVQQCSDGPDYPGRFRWGTS